MSDIRVIPRKLTGHALLLPTDGRDDGGKRWHRYTPEDRAWLCECGFAMGNLDMSEKAIRQRFHRPHLREVFSLNDRMTAVETTLDRMSKTNVPWREDMRQQIAALRQDVASLLAIWA